MKLKLLFIVMDLLTILAYPLVFVHSKLHLFSKASLWRMYSLLFQLQLANDRLEVMNIRKKGMYAYAND